MIDKLSKYYPYQKVQDNYYTLKGTEQIPRKICDYLIDAPKGEYQPPDDNDYPRCRFWKLLYHDGETPLEKELPTIKEKMSVVFNPDKADTPPTDKGWRLVPQIYIKSSQEDAQSRVSVYMGRTVPSQDELSISISVVFRIWTHYQYEANSKDMIYNRAFAIEQALIEAFHGVNIDGIGTFSFSRAKHPDCGSVADFDGDTNVGRILTMCLEIMTDKNNGITDYTNMPFADNPNIRFV